MHISGIYRTKKVIKLSNVASFYIIDANRMVKYDAFDMFKVEFAKRTIIGRNRRDKYNQYMKDRGVFK